MDKKESELQAEIARLRAKVAEQNETISALHVAIDDYKQKEQSISSAIIGRNYIR